MNTIYIKNEDFNGKTLKACCNIINEFLTAQGFEGGLLKVAKLANLDDFELGDV
jgi:hypothetical protein